MQVVCEATQCSDKSVQVAALQNLVKIMSLYYQFMEAYMGPALFTVSHSLPLSERDTLSVPISPSPGPPSYFLFLFPLISPPCLPLSIFLYYPSLSLSIPLSLPSPQNRLCFPPPPPPPPPDHTGCHEGRRRPDCSAGNRVLVYGVRRGGRSFNGGYRGMYILPQEYQIIPGAEFACRKSYST